MGKILIYAVIIFTTYNKIQLIGKCFIQEISIM